jgi:hypothetical protein
MADNKEHEHEKHEKHEHHEKVEPGKKIRLKHSITHNGIEYTPGIHELPAGLAAHFLETAPHAAELLEDPEQAGSTKPGLGMTKEADDKGKRK